MQTHRGTTAKTLKDYAQFLAVCSTVNTQS